jgi:hypothetical protein
VVVVVVGTVVVVVVVVGDAEVVVVEFASDSVVVVVGAFVVVVVVVVPSVEWVTGWVVVVRSVAPVATIAGTEASGTVGDDAVRLEGRGVVVVEWATDVTGAVVVVVLPEVVVQDGTSNGNGPALVG